MLRSAIAEMGDSVREDSVRGIMSSIRLGMGWVGSWVHKFTWQWVGLGWTCMSVHGLGWVVGYENGPMDNSGYI